MQKLIIAVVLVMMIAGGAISALKFLEIGPFSLEETAAVDPNAPVENPDESPNFVELKPIFIPVIAQDKVVVTYRIQIQLETYGYDNKQLLLKMEPKLNDIFIRDLHAFIPRLFRNKKELDVSIVKKRLELIAQRSTKPGIITGVLVQSVTNN
jgi:flagellar basal body-associated protein FliL